MAVWRDKYRSLHCRGNAANHQPFFVGTIEVQNKRRTAGMMSLIQETGEFAPALDALQQLLLDRFSVKQVWQKEEALNADPELPRSAWTGKVLLVSDKKISGL